MSAANTVPAGADNPDADVADEVPWVIVTAYHPDHSVMSNIAAMARQARVVVVDDGSGTHSVEELNTIESMSGVDLLRHTDNFGIATALNTGCRHAIRLGATILITFDQDSSPVDDHVSRVVSALRGHGTGLVSIVGPGKVGGLNYRGSMFGAGLLSVAETIQSGLALTTETHKFLGGFDDKLFIDGVDTEYCLRARRRGLTVAVLEDLTLEHSLGDGVKSTRLKVGRFRPVATGHSAFRRYYITRNKIVLVMRYGWSEPRWALRTVRQVAVGNVLAISIENNRLGKFRYICRGMLDGVLGRSGRMDARSRRWRIKMGLP